MDVDFDRINKTMETDFAYRPPSKEKEMRTENATDAIEAMVLMAEGNPGAITVLMGVAQHPAGGLEEIKRLDEQGIYGSSLWIAYKDECGEDMNKMLADLADGSLKTRLCANPEYIK